METFREPAAKYGIHPFWFWNGDMDDAEIVRQIGEMADKGVGGFFICPRQGLKVPYLSTAWFQKVRLAVEQAAAFGLEVWLYDEYPYPSGIAGGEVVLEHPDAKHCTLVHRTARVAGGEMCSLELPWARLLYARAVPVDPATGRREWDRALDVSGSVGNYQAEPVFQKVGLTAYNQKRFFTYATIKKLLWTAPAEGGAVAESEREWEWEVHCFLEEEVADFKYYGTYVDPCNEKAMRTFIELTHERYARELGEHFGKTIKGVFTDEIGLLGKLPWSPKLRQAFRERNGYDLTDHLPALLYADAEGFAKIRYDYYQTVHELIRRAYHQQVYDWCERHGLLYAAEVPSVRMATQRYSHVPGGDSGHEKLGRPLGWILDRYAYSLRYNPKMISSIANQLDRKRALIECFHSVGWSMTLQDAKWMIDRLAALGANFFNFHAFFYTLDGLTKHDAPPSQFVQNPYWRYFGKLGGYVRRISYAMTCGKPVRPVAVLDPTTTFWTHMGNPFHEFGYGGVDEREKAALEALKLEWREICKTLTLHQRDFDHLDPEILCEAEVRDGRIRIGKAAYEVVVIPPVRNLEAAAWRKLKAFMYAGGKVIACGSLPQQSIDGSDEVPREMAEMFGERKAEDDGAADASGGKADASGSGSPVPTGYPAHAGGGGRNGAYTVGSHEELVELLDAILPEEVVFAANEPGSFLMQRRMMDDGAMLVFISQQEAGEQEARLIWPRMKGALRETPRDEPAQFGIPHIGENKQPSKIAEVCRLCLETGCAVPLSVETSEDGEWVSLHFAPYESHLLLVRYSEAEGGKAEFAEDAEYAEATAAAGNLDDSEKSPLAARTAEWVWEPEAKRPWTVRPEHHNALRLDTFELRVGRSESDLPERGAVVRVKTFIDQCSDIADEQHVPLAFEQIFGTPMQMSAAYPICAVYTVSFAIEHIPDKCELMMDRGAISGEWVVLVNGHAIRSVDLQETFVYDAMNRRADISRYIRSGINTLAVEVEVSHDWDGVVDAIYLLGEFGVRHDGRMHILTKPPVTCSLSGDVIAGYPYYAGTFLLLRTVEIAELPEEEMFSLRFSDWDPNFHDCAEVIVNGVPLGARPWTPYVWSGRTELLRQGENEVEVRITTSLIGMLEGKRFDYATHTLQPAIDPPSG